jgi:TonB family protein
MISTMIATAIQQEWVDRVIDGRFTLLQWLGGSDHSSVFLTELPGDPTQKAAIKLEDEAEGSAGSSKLSHPHLVRIFETGRCEIDGTPLRYTVSEYADEVLADVLNGRALTPDEVREMLGPVLEALSYLHSRGLVHTRLKPSNILAINDVLKLSADDVLIAGSNSRKSEAIYDAPERAEGIVSPECDLWSLGVLLVEVLTGRPPEWDHSEGSALVVTGTIPEPFERILEGCLQPNPKLRFTLDDVRAILDPARPAAKPEPKAEPKPITPPVPEPEEVIEEFPTESRAEFRSRIEEQPRRGSRFTILIVACVILAAVIAFFLMRGHGPQPAPEQQPQQQASGPEEQPKPSAATPASPEATPAAPEAAPATPQAPPQPQAPVRGRAATNRPLVKGSVDQRAMPEVEPAASRTIHGTVRVRIRVNVDSSGMITGATFDSEGPSRYFAKAALKAAQQWKFKPAQVDGLPAASVWVLQFQFRRDGNSVDPVETSP